MIFIIVAVLVVIAAVIIKRMVTGGAPTVAKQADEVYELLEDYATPRSREEFLNRVGWEHRIPDPDHTAGCFVILTYDDKRSMRNDLDSYNTAYVGFSSKSAASASIKHLMGQGNPRIAKEVRELKHPFAVALLQCEDYGMDSEDCAEAVKKVLADDRLARKKSA